VGDFGFIVFTQSGPIIAVCLGRETPFYSRKNSPFYILQIRLFIDAAKLSLLTIKRKARP